jgi:hypothetical protein
MRLRLLLLTVPALLLAGCGHEPFSDADLRDALSSVDHVASARAACSQADLSWRCGPVVDLDREAGARDIAAAITQTASLTEADRDEVTVTIGAGDTSDPEVRGVTVTFTTPPDDVDGLATAARAALSSPEVGHAGFDADREGLSITATFVADTTVSTIAEVSRSLLDSSGAGRVLAVTPTADVRFTAGAAADSWPEAELAVLEAVDGKYPVEKTVVRPGFLGILLGEGSDVAGARALATAQPGSATIRTVVVTDDAEVELSNAGELNSDLASIADALAQQPGYMGVRLGEDSLRIDADSLDHAEAMDAMLQQTFGAASTDLDVTYRIERVATVERPAGTVAWFDTARTLVDSGRFEVVQVGGAAPADGVRVIFVRAAEGVTPEDAAGVVARAWQPNRDVEVKLGWQSDPPATIIFAGAETVSIRPSARVPQDIATSIEKAWAQGRTAAG